jgi:hypothetical protein
MVFSLVRRTGACMTGGLQVFLFLQHFPSVDICEGDVRRFLISSPDVDLIGLFVKGLNSI